MVETKSYQGYSALPLPLFVFVVAVLAAGVPIGSLAGPSQRDLRRTALNGRQLLSIALINHENPAIAAEISW